MAVMAREAWTDERLDDLRAGVENGFGRVDAEICELRSEMNDLRSEMKKGFERVDAKFDALQSEMNARFESMQRTTIIGFVTLFASMIGGVFATLALG